MYVQVAHYNLGTGTAEDLRPRVQEGPVKVMREVPGFVDYYAFDAGGRVVASVAVFADRTGLEEAERRLAGWVEQTVSELDQHPSGGLATAGTWPCRIAQAPFGAPASSKSPKPARAI